MFSHDDCAGNDFAVKYEKHEKVSHRFAKEVVALQQVRSSRFPKWWPKRFSRWIEVGEWIATTEPDLSYFWNWGYIFL